MLASWSISTRIYAGFAVVLTLLSGLAIFTVLSMDKVTDIFSGYRGTALQTLYLNDFKEDLYQARMAVMKYRIDESDSAVVEVGSNIQEIIAENRRLAEVFPGDAEAQDALRALGAETQTYQAIFSEMTQLQARRNDLVARLDEVGPQVRADIAQLMETGYRVNNRDVTFYSGRALENMLAGRMHSQRFLLTNDRAAFDDAIASLAAARDGLADLTMRIENDQMLDILLEAAEHVNAYIMTLEEITQVIVDRNDLRANGLDTIGPRMQARYEELTDTVVAEQNRLGPEAAAAIGATRLTAIAAGAGAVLIGAALAWMIGSWITRAVRAQAESMRRMADGDLEITVTGDQHKHELGRMAAALKVFQQNGLEKRRLDAEAREAAAREKARAAETDKLRQRVGDAVEKAVAGDFSGRVRDDFAEEGLNRFAGMVNTLMQTVADGVDETVKVMASLARGDLDARMSGRYSGAFAELQTNVNGTVDKLRETVRDIQSSADAIKTATGEIAQGAGDLSSRAENQAASLEEIAATMEQMSATVKKNAENAVNASTVSADARERADKGGAVVAEAVTAMSQIEEGSGKIAEIVTVIDGFAFQTNLLALNAAVEAARAGEAGKGFAVVASEVRTLAQRSADAARDIKALIQDSSHQVSDGVRLVTETGESLKEIVDAIRQVSDTITEISEASREQSAGVDEITAAITSMDEITQQNSALADESASAAKGLSERAAGLEDMMRFFTISGGGASAVAAPDPVAADAAAWDADAAADAVESDAAFAAQ